jgi:hypothetical protein
VWWGDSFDYNFVGFGTYTLEKIERYFVLFEGPLKIDIIVQRRGFRVSHVITNGQSVSQSWCRAPSGTHDQIFSRVEVWQAMLALIL